jgi:hypothetical protein
VRISGRLGDWHPRSSIDYVVLVTILKSITVAVVGQDERSGGTTGSPDQRAKLHEAGFTTPARPAQRRARHLGVRLFGDPEQYLPRGHRHL